jgi:hypothetical protein
MIEIFGYLAAVLIGVSLGLIGGGGSILTVPALVYLMGVAPVTATAYSLFIVGATSLVGGVQKYIQGNVDIRAALYFGIPSIVAVYLTRLLLVPAIPEIIAETDGFLLTRDIFIMILFALLMVTAAWTMIRTPHQVDHERIKVGKPRSVPLVFVEGTVVGILTGLVGAGGGFLIIPALVLLGRLPMKLAVGTSLVIIAAKSLIGFLGDLFHMQMDWVLLLSFTVLAVGGIFLGNRWSHRFDNNKLKKAFGWFVLVMGIYIILRETVGR